MIQTLTIILVFLGVGLALQRWRWGVFVFVVAGFLQDPIRKLFPNQPPYFVLFAALFFFVTYISLFARGIPLRLSSISARDGALRTAWQTFMLLAALQCAHTLVGYGNLALFGLGLAAYFAPVAAALLGQRFPRNERDMTRFLTFYVVLAVPFSLTVYLSHWFGSSWDILKDVGTFVGQQMVMYEAGVVLPSNPGVFRVGEIAAWHAATACVLLTVVATLRPSTLFRALVGVVIILLVGAIVLTGRRKALVLLTMFFGVYWFLLAYYWRGAMKVAVVALTLGIAATAVLVYMPEAFQSAYWERSATVFGEISERAMTALGLLQSAIRKFGFLGAGAGVSAQGSQYFGGGSALVSGSAEAGIGKLVVELGVPGLLVISWLGLMLARHFHRVFRRVSRRYRSLNVLMAGLSAFLVANAATFAVAAQIYGDVFIFLLLGLVLGFLFATERMAGEWAIEETRLAHGSAYALQP
jgi:hypothetical protein